MHGAGGEGEGCRGFCEEDGLVEGEEGGVSAGDWIWTRDWDDGVWFGDDYVTCMDYECTIGMGMCFL